MRSHCPILLSLAALTWVALSGGADTSAERIARLVARLGSMNFTEREEATKELDAIGADAVPALKRATQSDDAETRRRAEDLVARIEKRLESKRLLTPTTVTLTCNDTPLTDAVADFAKKTGQPVALGNDQTKLEGRTVSLDLVDVPFWQALDRFCAAAGVMEASTVTVPLDAAAKLRSGRRMRDALPGPVVAASPIV